MVTLQYEFEEGELMVVNSDFTVLQIVGNAIGDFSTIWLSTSGMAAWLRVWLLLLFLGVMAPLGFLPHAFAVANLVGAMFIMIFNGRELIRVRGINKNMGML